MRTCNAARSVCLEATAFSTATATAMSSRLPFPKPRGKRRKRLRSFEKLALELLFQNRDVAVKSGWEFFQDKSKKYVREKGLKSR